MERVLGIQFNEIKLNDYDQAYPMGVEQVQLLRVGEFNHALYGKFSITKDTLKKLHENFIKKVRRIDLAVDYFHETDKVAAGWIREVELREDDNELWIHVDWTKSGKRRLEEKELRYISADFDFSYTDSETGINYGPTLLGAGLTNRPHVKDMKPIILKEFTDEQIEKLKVLLSENDKENSMSLEEIKKQVQAMSPDDRAQLYSMLKEGMDKVMKDEKKLEEENMNKEMEKQLSEKENEIKELKAKIEKQEREGKFNVMLSEGKVVEAQREFYIKGDMENFINNAQVLNLSEKGSGSTGDKEEMTREKAEIKLSELADKIMAERSIDYSEAMSVALDENPELAKKFN